MARYDLSLPRKQWPVDLRIDFDEAFATTAPAHLRRLSQAFGRWLKASLTEGLPASAVTPEIVSARTAGLRLEMAASMRQAVQAVFPEARVFIPTARVSRRSDREAAQHIIQRNWHRLPIPWQAAAEPLLHFDAEGLEDGWLIQAWSISTITARFHSAWAFFDFCRSQGCPEEVTPATLTARLNAQQVAFNRGDLSLSTAVIEVTRLKDLGCALFPRRDWAWMQPVINFLKKKARLQPTRSNSRLVSLVELKAAATQAGEVALAAHRNASDHKARVEANKMARSGLGLSLLVNSPIRLTCLTLLDLQRHFNQDLTVLTLSAHETKDGKRDVRAISPSLQKQLITYIQNHRAALAPEDETLLFIGRLGEPVTPHCLTDCIGDLTELLFKKRVTAQVVRNVVAGFIVSEAPEEAGLASVILNHSDPRTTDTYRAEATQIQASRRMEEAVRATKEAISVPCNPKRPVATRPRLVRTARAARTPKK